MVNRSLPRIAVSVCMCGYCLMLVRSWNFVWATRRAHCGTHFSRDVYLCVSGVLALFFQLSRVLYLWPVAHINVQSYPITSFGFRVNEIQSYQWADILHGALRAKSQVSTIMYCFRCRLKIVLMSERVHCNAIFHFGCAFESGSKKEFKQIWWIYICEKYRTRPRYKRIKCEPIQTIPHIITIRIVQNLSVFFRIFCSFEKQWLWSRLPSR